MKILFHYFFVALLVLLYSCSTKQERESKSAPLLKKTTTNPQRSRFKPSTLICEQTALSEQFDVIVEARHDKSLSEGIDSCTAKLVMRDKNTKAKLDSLFLTSSYFSSCAFKDCSKVRSYTTSYKMNEDVIDGQYGDIVVADLNFDGRDDIAVVNDCGGNGGPLYSYYLQNTKKHFVLDKFLTNEMGFFPDEIDVKRRQLKTIVHAGVWYAGEDIYQYSSSSGKWKRISQRFKEVND